MQESIKFKRGVKFHRDGRTVKARTLEAIFKVGNLMVEEGRTGRLNTITSVMDGKHREDSKHYSGDAFDLRTWADGWGRQLPKPEKIDLAEKISDLLGPDWDIVVEKTHIHCEYDPKDY